MASNPITRALADAALELVSSEIRQTAAIVLRPSYRELPIAQLRKSPHGRRFWRGAKP